MIFKQFLSLALVGFFQVSAFAESSSLLSRPDVAPNFSGIGDKEVIDVVENPDGATTIFIPNDRYLTSPEMLPVTMSTSTDLGKTNIIIYLFHLTNNTHYYYRYTIPTTFFQSNRKHSRIHTNFILQAIASTLSYLRCTS